MRLVAFLLLLSNFSFSNQMIIQRRDQIKKWASTCDYNGKKNIMSLHGMANEWNKCEEGDAILFAGISCLASRLSGDLETSKHRCRNVSDGQDENGRWWRGYTNIGNTEDVSFSRDMGLGVLAYLTAEGVFNQNPLINNKVRMQAKKWIHWIEHSGKSSRMCLEKLHLFDNRCRINSGFGALMYKVFSKISAIDSTNKNYKFIKKIKRLSKIYTDQFVSKETIFAKNITTPLRFTSDYEFHLKSVYVLISRIISGNNKHLNEIMRNIFLFEPLNPVYQVLYHGSSSTNVNNLLELCPANKDDLYRESSWLGKPVFNRQAASWWPQRSFHKLSYMKSIGHDCIYALNLYLADQADRLNNSIVEKNKCDKNANFLGFHNNKLYCLSKKTMSLGDCLHMGGNTKLRLGHCTLRKKNYFLMKKISSTCPKNLKEISVIDGQPVCEEKTKKLHKCNAYEYSYRIKKNNKLFCRQYKAGYWLEKEIKGYCPIGSKYIDLNEDWLWPLCKNLKNIKKKKIEDCPKPIWNSQSGESTTYISKGYCGEVNKGYFRAYKIKN